MGKRRIALLLSVTVFSFVAVAVGIVQWSRREVQHHMVSHLPHMIPHVIYQTHESEDKITQSPVLTDAVNSWKALQPAYTHVFHDAAARKAFMHQHMWPSLADMYDRLPLGVMRADVWRYAVLYAFGGVYADSDTVLRDPQRVDALVQSRAQLVVAPEDTWEYFCQWVFAAPPKSPILLRVLQTIEARVRAQGVDRLAHTNEHFVHTFTGPGVFSDAIEAHLRDLGLPRFPRKRDYDQHYTPDHPVLTVLPIHFHGHHVDHLFAGDSGWKPQVQQLRSHLKT